MQGRLTRIYDQKLWSCNAVLGVWGDPWLYRRVLVRQPAYLSVIFRSSDAVLIGLRLLICW